MKFNEWFIFSVLLIVPYAFAEDNSKVILKEGINLLDINGDGVKDLIVYSRFENNTSHPNNTMTIFMKNKQGQYRIVPVPNDLSFTWSDFILSASALKISDYALYKKKNGYYIVSAHKVTGSRYGDDVAGALPVKFTRYDMNTEQDDPGVPPFSWVYTSAFITPVSYLDIDEALKHFDVSKLK